MRWPPVGKHLQEEVDEQHKRRCEGGGAGGRESTSQLCEGKLHSERREYT